jgi:hypothetical protein
MTELTSTEIRDQADKLRAEVARVERIGFGPTVGAALEPHHVATLDLMRGAADLLDRLASEEA